MAQADLAFDILARDRGATRTLDSVGESAERTGTRLQDIGDKAATGGGRLASLFGRIGPALAAGALAAGLAAGAALMRGVSQATERERLSDRLAAQLRATPEESKRFGAAAGKLYADAYGDSLATVNNAIRGVVANMTGMRTASQADLQAVAADALNLADIMEADVGQVTRAAGKLLKTGLARDAGEAMDLIAAAFTSGADEAGDLLDTLSEYSTQFRELGVSGPKALGLIAQGLRAGARDADTVADAIKEFAIRSKDGSVLSRQAFRTLGLDADAMFRTFARGGPQADAAFKIVIDRLKAIRDPVAQDATAVALFGTKAEDLGDALFALDPATAVKALGDIKTAAEDLDETLGDNRATRWTKFKRGVETFFTDLADKALSLGDKLRADPEVAAIWKDLKQSWAEVADRHMPQLKMMWDSLITSFKENKGEIKIFAELMAEAFFLVAGGLIQLAEWAVQGIGALVRLFSGATKVLIEHAGMILTGFEAAFGWIPGVGPKLTAAKRDFDVFAAKVNAALASIKDRDVEVRARLYMSDVPVAQGFGRRAAGGPVTAGMPVVVGEHRPELFVPSTDGMVLPSVPKTFGAAGAAGAGMVQVVIDVSGGDDLLTRWIRDRVRIDGGGNVQVAFGRGSR